MTFEPTYIDVMRHGEPIGSCPKGGTILRGRTDNALTEKGWLQAKARCQSILDSKERSDNERPWDLVISSPLIRCADFAKQLHDELFAPAGEASTSLLINNQWREIDYGDWDGKSTADIWQQQPELMAQMWKNPLEFCAPKGEPVKDFSLRIAQAWLDLLNEHRGKRILLVCHGGVMRVLLQQLLMMSPEGMNRFAIPYAAMTRFRVDHSLSDDFIADDSNEEGIKAGAMTAENIDSENISSKNIGYKNISSEHIENWPSLLNHYSNDLV